MTTIINSLERTATVANLVESLRGRILLKEFDHGHAITEAALAKEYGISRGSVRTAMQTLEGEGVIAALPNGRKQVVGITEKYIHDLYHTRMIIECEAARQILALRHVDFAPMAAMVSRFQEIAEAPAATMRSERTGVNMQFHRALVGMSKNRPLLQCWLTIDPMLEALIRFNSDMLKPETHTDDYVESHKKILEMFLAYDAEVIPYLEFHALDAPLRDTVEGYKALNIQI